MTQVINVTDFEKEHGLTFEGYWERQNQVYALQWFKALGLMFALEIPSEVHGGRTGQRLFGPLKTSSSADHFTVCLDLRWPIHMGFKTDQLRADFIKSRKFLVGAAIILQNIS